MKALAVKMFILQEMDDAPRIINECVLTVYKVVANNGLHTLLNGVRIVRCK